MQTPRLSLFAKIFLSSAGIVALVLATALLVTSGSAQRAARANIVRGLDATQQRVQELITSERAQLASRANVYAQNPDYRASFETPTDSGNYLDFARTAAEELGAQWVQLVSADGVRLAKSDDAGAPRDTVRSPLVRTALEGTAADGFGVAGDTALLEIISVPIPGANRRIIGALMAAKYVSDSVVRAAGATTQSEVLFYALDRNEQPHVTAATDLARRAGAAVLAAVDVHGDSGVQQARSAGASTPALTNVDIDVREWRGGRRVHRAAVARQGADGHGLHAAAQHAAFRRRGRPARRVARRGHHGAADRPSGDDARRRDAARGRG
jgi:hypothetical protein